MPFLSTILSFLFGKGLSTVTVPVLALGLLVSLYHNIQGRRDAASTKIETTATAQCNARWLLLISKKKERDANGLAQEAQQLLQGERDINKGLNDDLDRIRAENETLRSSFSSADDKCLSDGVLTALGGRKSVGSQPATPGGAAKDKSPSQ